MSGRIFQPFPSQTGRLVADPITLSPEQSPFTVDELIRMGVDHSDACMIVWPVTEEAFAAYAESKKV